MTSKEYFVYIMASESGTLYIGMTNNLQRRVYEHKEGLISSFTEKYNCKKLIYFETTNDVDEAISREKQLKGWVRTKKENLIKTLNPSWKDLSKDF